MCRTKPRSERGVGGWFTGFRGEEMPHLWRRSEVLAFPVEARVRDQAWPSEGEAAGRQARARRWWLAGALFVLGAMIAAGTGLARPGWAAERPTISSGRAEPPKRPERKIRPGQPVRLAVLTVAVHTPIFVRAYELFQREYGEGKLVLDLWIEQDWMASPRPLRFEDYDMILALRCSIPGLEQAVAAAARRGVWVVTTSTLKYRDSAVLIDEVPELAPYYRLRGVSNMVGLFEKVCELFQVPGITARPAQPVEVEGIYHPDADRVFPDGASYWRWYRDQPTFKPGAPRVGLFVYNTLYLNEETDYFTQLIRAVEQTGANPILGFWFLPVGQHDDSHSPILRFFAGVDVLLTSSFRLVHEKRWHYEELQKLDVPVLNSIILNVPQQEWRRNRQGISGSYLLPGIVNPEVSGVIEPTVIAARQAVSNDTVGRSYYRTILIGENFRWQVRRALAWARLRRRAPAERRIAILFYNHGGGKHNVGASYLNVTGSLEQILAEMARCGYRVEGKIQRQAILDAMLAVGHNVGSWAPGEAERLVQAGSVLWPLEKYLMYYDRLPDSVRRDISRRWGQPPGNVMTVVREGRPCLIFPAFRLGNVLLAPQPSRGSAERAAALYHDRQTWPTHQYLAFYFWLRNEWRADAVVHLGRHGTLEFLPGKSNGLAWDDAPAIALGDLPNIYPYVVDGIGEAVAAKRRGQAVLITHATPPLKQTALEGDLARLQELITNYRRADDQGQLGLRAEYAESISKLATELGYERAPAGADQFVDRSAAAGATGDKRIEAIEHWLTEVKSQIGPRGLHTFGQSYTRQDTESMLRRMFGDELAELSGAESDDETAGGDAVRRWLAEVAEAGSEQPPPERLEKKPPSDRARSQSAGEGRLDLVRNRIAATAWSMRHNQEMDFLMRALDGRFIPVGPPGDPLSNPEIFPTGRNQYQYNPKKFPTREAWAVGSRVAQQTLEIHRQRHGRYPTKLSVVLWANTLIRTHGVLESEVLYFLGLEPVWNRRGDVVDVRLISPLGRPRVDVVLTVTGMYRDSFPDKILLLDKAVRMACKAPAEDGVANYVNENTERLIHVLTDSGVSLDESRKLAALRIFGARPGVYGTGVADMVGASDQWSHRGELAGQYLARMSFAFSSEDWGQPARECFERQLRGIEGVIHARSSHLYGVIDRTENFEYQGALAMAVEQIEGKQPELYINDLVQGEKVFTGREAIVLEMLSRYQNPEFIRAMMAEGYDGARYLSRIVDNQFGWDVVSDVITAKDWKRCAEIYLDDKYQLGLPDFFQKHSPHALQNIASRVLEVHRKGLQELDATTLASAARVYVETIAQHGPSCSSHVCRNPKLNAFAARLAGNSQRMGQRTLRRFREQLQRAGDKGLAGASSEPTKTPQPVEGYVLTPPPPSPRSSNELASKPESPPSASSSVHEPPASPSNGVQVKNWPLMLLSAGLCSLAFLAGIAFRAVNQRRRV
ncbi:MAG: cobaltochelatase subunit CobN [Planctomycetes bacterium]|nr:cobaltochelatase subunit CobN [Planctomycetota bacterium]